MTTFQNTSNSAAAQNITTEIKRYAFKQRSFSLNEIRLKIHVFSAKQNNYFKTLRTFDYYSSSESLMTITFQPISVEYSFNVLIWTGGNSRKVLWPFQISAGNFACHHYIFFITIQMGKLELCTPILVQGCKHSSALLCRKKLVGRRGYLYFTITLVFTQSFYHLRDLIIGFLSLHNCQQPPAYDSVHFYAILVEPNIDQTYYLHDIQHLKVRLGSSSLQHSGFNFDNLLCNGLERGRGFDSRRRKEKRLSFCVYKQRRTPMRNA